MKQPLSSSARWLLPAAGIAVWMAVTGAGCSAPFVCSPPCDGLSPAVAPQMRLGHDASDALCPQCDPPRPWWRLGGPLVRLWRPHAPAPLPPPSVARFHPVPTRPVFQPAGDLTWYDAASPLPPRDGSGPGRDEPQPDQPELAEPPAALPALRSDPPFETAAHAKRDTDRGWRLQLQDLPDEARIDVQIAQPR